MKNYPRHRATAPNYIFKESYEELIKSAKRKHTDEFFVFETAGWYSEDCVDVYGEAIEHWTKDNGKWHKEA